MAVDAVATANKVFFARIDGAAHAVCHLCGDAGVIWETRIVAGPFRSAPGTYKVVTWLDQPVVEKPGWYEVERKKLPCPACNAGAERARLYAQKLRERCGLVGDELAYRLDWYRDKPHLRRGKEAALEAVGEMMARLPRVSGMLFLYGPPGVGKSGAAKALIAAALEVTPPVPALYTTMTAYLSAVRDSYSGGHDPRPEVREKPLLVVDEVDRMSDTSWAREQVFDLLDWRHRNRERMATVLISNATPEMLKERGLAYLTSRLMQGVVVEMGGLDLRDSGV